MNVQDECIKIHSKFGMSEMANYKIQLLFDSEIAKFKKSFETNNGIGLIAVERKEQIEKHGFLDSENLEFKSNEELKKCAIFCLTLNGDDYPENWGDWFLDNVEAKQTRMSESEFKIEMLKIAGAFCAAEIDRLQAIK